MPLNLIIHSLTEQLPQVEGFFLQVEYLVNTMAADDLAPCVARASAAMTLT